MTDQLIDLSPKGILGYMKRIEGAIQKSNFILYTPIVLNKYKSEPITDSALVEETQSMLDFVGLGGYAADVKFTKTEDGVAGNITSANNTMEKAVHINVSENYKNKWECCIAILSHEICHKLLASHGLYDPDTQTNETLVDLSTIYVGFGELILNGYVSSSDSQIMGYLNMKNYKVAHHIISIVYGDKTVSNTGLEDTDVLIDHALKFWTGAQSEYELLKDCFSENEKQESELFRNLCILEQLIKQCKSLFIKDYLRFDNLFFKTLHEENGKYINKLTALGILYDLIAKDSYPKHSNNEYVSNLNSLVNNAIYDLFQQIQSRDNVEIKYDFECPCCGAKMTNNHKVVNRNAILRCAKCGTHYYFFGENWNFSSRQKELKEMKIKENELIEEKASELAKKYQEIAELRVLKAKEDAQKVMDTAKALRDATRKIIDEEVDKVKEDSWKKIDDIKVNEQNRYRDKVLGRVPLYLRWLIDKYF